MPFAISLAAPTDTAQPYTALCFTRLLHHWAFVRALETTGLWNFRGDESALDIGSGAGELSLVLAERAAHVVALDLRHPPLDALRLWRKGGRCNIVHRARLDEFDEFDEFDVIASYLGLRYADIARLKNVLGYALRCGGRFFALCPRFWFEDGEALEPAERALGAYAQLPPLTPGVLAAQLESARLRVIETPPLTRQPADVARSLRQDPRGWARELKLPRAPVARILEISGCAEAVTPTGGERLLAALGLSLRDTVPTALLAVEKV